MTKTLFILRHAKSSWKDDELADHDRPLSKRGKRDAPRIGRRLQQAGLTPDLILSSTAKRARKTAAKVAESSGYQGEIQLAPELYLAHSQAHIDVLSNLADRFERVMVVGHNPGLEHLLEQLTQHEQRLPTGALAQVELDVQHWRDLCITTPATLVRLSRRRELD